MARSRPPKRRAARTFPGIRTRATRVDGGYELNGSKIWCTNSDVADFVLVGAKCAGADGKDSINLFIVEKGTPGFSVGRKEDKMGARGVPSCPLFFDDAFVPEANRMGPEGGQGFKLVMEAFNTSRPIVAARAVGLAQGAIDHADGVHSSRRKAFGRRISDFQGVRWMLADMAMQTEAARQLTYKAASMVDAGVTGPELGKHCRDGQVLRLRRRDESRDRRRTTVRRGRRLERVPDQPLFPRREGRADHRRHEPDPAQHHREHAARSRKQSA